MKLFFRFVLLSFIFSLTFFKLNAQWVQQGQLLSSDGIKPSSFGFSVSLSADGNTALIGGYEDNFNNGAAWIFTKSGNTWKQQGSKLFSKEGSVSLKSNQGVSVALSADGKTAIIGAVADSSGNGSALIFVKKDSFWIQQGSKLIAKDAASGFASFGKSVAISADGNTVVIGGDNDSSAVGAAWIFTRLGSTWSQQGKKLVGQGGNAVSVQGWSVAISADGNTILTGGFFDDSGKGSVWVFTRSGTTWLQQGNKLPYTGAIGNANFGTSVSLSSDGNTAIIGGSNDNSNIGAAWVFMRSGNVWSQMGSKLVGTGTVGTIQSFQGASVAVSGDGNTIMIGGPGDNNNVGAVWIFIRSFNTWIQQGNKILGVGGTGTSLQGGGVSLSYNGASAITGAPGDNGYTGTAWIFYNKTLSVESVNNKSKVKIYPSLTDGNLTIESSKQFEIVNLSGHTVWSDKQDFVNTKKEINLNNLPNGIYIISGSDNDGILFSEKIVKH